MQLPVKCELNVSDSSLLAFLLQKRKAKITDTIKTITPIVAATAAYIVVFEELDFASFAIIFTLRFAVCCVVVSRVVADVDWMELLALEICVACICDVNLRSVTIASVERRGKTGNKVVERIGVKRASLARAVVVFDIRVVDLVASLDCVLTSIVFGRETVVGTDVVEIDTDGEVVVGDCVIPSTVVEIGFDVEPDCVESDADRVVVVGSRVLGSAVVGREVVVGTDVVACAVLDSDLETLVGNCVLTLAVVDNDSVVGADCVVIEADVEVVVGNCVLPSAVVDNDTVVGADVDCVAIGADVETVVNTNCVLPSAVVGDTTVVATDVDCVVIEADVVGFLVVERYVVAATVVDCAVDICTEDTRKQQDFSLLYNTIIITSSYQ